jgi:hypothetical protein
MCSSVIDPLGRYRYVKQMVASGTPSGDTDEVLPCHDAYYRAGRWTRPVRRPARAGGKLELPPVLYLQARKRIREINRSFRRGYRRAGGVVDLQLFEVRQGFMVLLPARPQPTMMIEFRAQERSVAGIKRKILDRIGE